MFRDVRRKDRLESTERAAEVLNECTNGILSVTGDDGWPYGVPVNYVYKDGKIYLHCARSGHKLDAIAKDSRVCFTVVGADNIVPERCTTMYVSIICFGYARVVEDPDLKHEALVALAQKFSPNHMDYGMEHIRKDGHRCTVVEISIEHMTAKEKS